MQCHSETISMIFIQYHLQRFGLDVDLRVVLGMLLKDTVWLRTLRNQTSVHPSEGDWKSGTPWPLLRPAPYIKAVPPSIQSAVFQRSHSLPQPSIAEASSCTTPTAIHSEDKEPSFFHPTGNLINPLKLVQKRNLALQIWKYKGLPNQLFFN